MDDDLSYVATPSKEYQSRELDAFNEAIHGDEPRFTHFEGKMFSEDWANNELIPFLRVAYRAKPGITLTHNWWEELRKAEFIEPANMVASDAIVLPAPIANPHSNPSQTTQSTTRSSLSACAWFSPRPERYLVARLSPTLPEICRSPSGC
ncbi:hypothetical protein BDV95DRAFT_591268 [Massariosphaeria phaeospora]|uniref:Uncharacterized protein n=1 Tax=Massariosphaeria phaeospora TaxID=100035 RepID=A0A7C8MEN2_9PLEO|nr:hypothetical protein BDV95DRAFT_591268 [Massariosphaeria phaeospora]